MSADELPFGANDRIETEPAELHGLFINAMTSSLSKRLAVGAGKPWTQALETAHQEAISALVAAAKSKGISALKVTSVKPDGRRVELSISLDKISKDRVLQ